MIVSLMTDEYFIVYSS